MKAFILAAGLGTRLRPLTDRMPKALVPVGGVPLLEQVVIRLKDAGYDDIVVNVHHFADMIEDFLDEKGNFGIKMVVSDERALLRETYDACHYVSARIVLIILLWESEVGEIFEEADYVRHLRKFGLMKQTHLPIVRYAGTSGTSDYALTLFHLFAERV